MLGAGGQVYCVPTESIAGLSEAVASRSEIDSRGAAALWFRLEIKSKSNHPDQKKAQAKKPWMWR